MPDADWLRSKDRSFPITVDPDLRLDGLTAPNGQLGVVDTFIASGEPYQNFNGLNLNIGYCSVNHGETYSYAKWNLSSLANQQIANAQLSIYPSWTNANTATQPINMWHVAQDWDPNTLTWDLTRYGPGNHDNVLYSLYNANGGGERTYNMTDWVRNWTNGTWPNYGVSMDGAGAPNVCYVLKSQEDGVYAPRLIVTTALAVDAGPDTGRCDCMGYFDQTIDPTTGMFVNLGNGNLQVSATDLSAPGRGMDLRVERNWSSLRSSTQHDFAARAQYRIHVFH